MAPTQFYRNMPDKSKTKHWVASPMTYQLVADIGNEEIPSCNMYEETAYASSCRRNTTI